jgi:hypothetical protein
MALNIPRGWAVIGFIVSALVFLAPTIRILWHKFKSPALPAPAKSTHSLLPYVSVVALFFVGFFGNIVAPALHDFWHALMVVALIGLLIEVPHIKHFFFEGLAEVLKPSIDLRGEWTYKVLNLQHELMQQGDCTITQTESVVRIKGTRTPDRIPWETRVGVIYGIPPSNLVFVYSIKLPEGEIEGYCNIPLFPVPIIKMEGEYYHLAPNKERGHVYFERKSMKSGFEPIPSLEVRAEVVQP